MGFFYTAAKQAAKKPAAKPRLADIPVASLNSMGCSVCPRDEKGAHMEGAGASSPDVYLLYDAPSYDDEDRGEHFTDKAGRAVFAKFRGRTVKRMRVGATVGCAGAAPPTRVEAECCRGRTAADIEQARPLVVVTVGDAAFQWATGMTSNALPWRGTFLPAKFGAHTCWVYPLLYPNFVFKKSYGKSEWELTLEHDVRALEDWLDADTHPAARVVDAGFYDGITVITGERGAADLELLEKCLQRLKGLTVGLDIETNALRPWGADPRILSCAVGTFDATVAFPLDHKNGWQTAGQRQRAWELFVDYLTESGPKVAHNLAMEMVWLVQRLGESSIRTTEWHDTMAACHTFDERPGTKSLGAQTRKIFGFDVKALSNIDAARIEDYPIEKSLKYNALDAKWTVAVHNHYAPLLAAQPAMRREYERKVRLAPALVMTEVPGLCVDTAYAQKLSDEFAASAKALQGKVQRTPEVRAYAQRFGAFNPGSPDHVLKLLRDICRRPEVVVEDKSGSRESTAEEVLSALPPAEVPSAALILELRGVEKLKGTYVDPVIGGRMVGADGRIHSQYGSMVAVTGRLNSEDPNIQNFPKRKHAEVRGFVVPSPGCVLMPCDYGQLEFRVAGMASEDPEIIKACWTGYDVHKFWAERLVAIYPEVKDWVVSEFGVDWDEKGLKTLRQEAKNKWVFPQIFGSSVKSCAANLHLPNDVAEDLAGEFWDTFRATKKWQEQLVQRYERNLYVETLSGRRRRGAMSKNEIINTPIQGTGADIVTAAQTELSELAYALDRPELNPRINVHDDLTFEPPEHLLDQTVADVAREMCRIRFDWQIVPMVVEVSVADRWSKATEIGVYRSDKIFGHRNPYE